MKRILVLGIGPLAIENSQTFHSGGNRAWHLTQPLLEKGFEVVMVCMRVTDSAGAPRPDEEIITRDNLTYYSCHETKCFANDDYLRQIIEKHQPDAIIGACDYPASRACAVAGNLPVWADIHGYPMGEAQAKAYHYNEPGYIHHFWNIHRPALFRGDRFSVTSERQRMALTGELGAMGRLNHKTFGEDLATTIPIAWDPNTPYQHTTRSKDDPFTVFFCGGYNLWCDVETLYRTLEIAMQQDPRIRFLGTGGLIEGHDEKTYPKFEAMVNASQFKNRFDLRGWVPREKLETCYQQANLGINCDLICNESLIGARNRITEWMARGVPILTSLMTEISQILFYKGAALTVPPVNPALMASEIILAANHPEKLANLSQQARKIFEESYTYPRTVGALIEWCKNPVRSGDGEEPPVILDYRREQQIQADAARDTSWRSKIKRKLGMG
ncbi:MAG: glycosyltransferase [Candidatus Hinthialibacter antarcticus]|nr:glycosyltransferase [Candidatus Hinthialibacter antarcticus]